MRMNKAGKLSIFVVAVFAMMAGAAAADADHSGSWHSVASKSSWSNGQDLSKFSLTINVQLSDNKIVYHSVNDNSPAANLDFTTSLDGKVSPMLNNARFNQVAVKKTGTNGLEILEMKDGDVIVGSYWTFSDDGKSFVRRGIGKEASGKSHEFEEFYTRQ